MEKVSFKELKNKNGNPLLYSNYKDYRKSLKGIINYAKKAHRLKLLKKAEENSKETWKIINEIRGKHKVKIKPSFIIHGNVIEERRVIANGFNKYFTSIASKLLNPFRTIQIMSKTLLNLAYTV